ncbi:DNA-lyase [Pyrenochaeta sp. MPI-SDFR-AT-0127]|nr:DNA-lyase [Pyrenochaeta sp. MPI-SDFR-AT-0127]
MNQKMVGSKRKAKTTIQVNKRAKQASTPGVKPEESVASAGVKIQLNERPTKSASIEQGNVEAEVKLGANGSDNITGLNTVACETKLNNKNGGEEVQVKKTSTRKTKNAKNVEPIAERTTATKHRIGAHVSSAGGVHNAPVNLIFIGGNAFALFLKNHKKWASPDLDPEHARLFTEGCKSNNIHVGDCCLPHGSYLVNLAHPDPERKKQAYSSFLNDLCRCHKLGIRLYNFHPGNANATTREEGIRLIAENINKAHGNPATGEVITVLETMASLGNTIGGTFADLAAIIELVNDKSRIGVCLDTCHVFAAGYDLRTAEAYAHTMQKFDKEIGLEYLLAFHINDSKAPFSSYRDLHARIGTGYLGLRAFHNIMNDVRFHGLPMILETPVSVIGEDGKKFEDKSIWAREIKMLEKLVGMDTKSDEFKELEANLQKEGEGERERIGSQVERRQVRNATTKKKRGKTKGESIEPE